MRVTSLIETPAQMTNSLIRVLKRRGDDFHVFHEDGAPSYDGDIQSDKIGSLALFQQKWRFISVPASRPRDDLSKAHSTGKVFASVQSTPHFQIRLAIQALRFHCRAIEQQTSINVRIRYLEQTHASRTSE